MWFHNTGLISAGSSVIVNVDSTNDGGGSFSVGKGSETTTGDTPLFIVKNDGDVGIGTTSPSQKLHIVGNLRVQGSTDCILGAGSGATNCTSDERLKDNVTPIKNSLDKIKSVKGVDFVWNEDSLSPGKKSIGVIAQDIQKVFPTAVIENDDGYLSVDYAVLVSPLIEATKEIDRNIQILELMQKGIDDTQNREIASLKESHEELQSKYNDVINENNEMKKQMSDLKDVVCMIKPDAKVCN
jgi:hypothetical protein